MLFGKNNHIKTNIKILLAHQRISHLLIFNNTKKFMRLTTKQNSFKYLRLFLLISKTRLTMKCSENSFVFYVKKKHFKINLN